MNIKVLLINPSYQPHWSLYEPTGLLYLATYLKKRGIEVKILDLNIEKLSTRECLNFISKFKPKFIGITAITRQALRAYHLGRAIKKRFSNIKLIYGGIHSTFLSEECFIIGAADFVVIGEGERTMYELVTKLNRGQQPKDIKGIHFLFKGKILKTKECSFIHNLDLLPFPDYSLVPLEKYNSSIHLKKYPGKTINMITSRGCSGNCYFCCSPSLYKYKIRFRSVENVIKEIKEVVNKYNVINIHFIDDNFLIDPKRILKFCRLIQENNLFFKWICLARVNEVYLHPEILPVMHKAGCVGIELGVETGDEYVLSQLNKNENLKQVYLANKYLKQNNIYPIFLIIAYLLGENIDSAYKSAKLYYELRGKNKINNFPISKDTSEPDLAGHFARPSPGTVFYKIATKRGICFAKNWHHHIEEELNFLPNEFIKDIAIINKKFNRDKFFSFFKIYNNNLQLFINQNFYNSKPIMNKFFADKIDELLKFMFKIYTCIDGKKTAEEIAKNFIGNRKANLIKTAVAISMLSIFRIVKSKN